MIPSKTWFPQSLQERAAWMQNFLNVLTPIAALLGILPADMTALGQDNEDFQSIANTMVAVDAFKKGVVEYRISLTEGDIGDPQPVFPSESFSGPPNDRPAGLFERINSLRERILAAPAYTDEMGASLGILPTSPSPVLEGDVQPTIEVFAAETGYMFSTVVTGRAKSDQWLVSIAPVGTTNWTTAATATGKSIDITYSPETPGQPVQLQVRVQLRKDNANYGQLSTITLVTLNP